jgi:hypothetical protein
MNSDNKRDKSISNKAAKAISTIPVAGIVVAVTLMLSGLSTVGSYHSVLAQQYSLTEGGGGNATTTGAAVGNGFETTSLPCQPPLCIGNATTGAAGGNATTTAGGVNQSEVRTHLEEARTALQNNDIQGVLTHLDLALNLLGGSTQGNMTSTAGSTNSTG